MIDCLLGKERNNLYCRGACGTCGWNPKVANARNEKIAANGLAVGPDGIRRLIIRRSGKAND